ncbi:MAG: flagellar biosynthesis regulator FlaF [Solirubrobacterales bacterium]
MKMTVQSTVSLAEEVAFHLSQSAILLDKAKAERARDLNLFAGALESNFELWTKIETIVNHEGCLLNRDAKDNLRRLAKFVSQKTFEGMELSDRGLDTLVGINLQIAEGFLEGSSH